MDLNATITESMRNYTAGKIVQAYKLMIGHLKQAGLKQKSLSFIAEFL